MYTRRGLLSRLLNYNIETVSDCQSERNNEPPSLFFPEIPELTDETILNEAIKLGIDPSNRDVKDLRRIVITAMENQKPRKCAQSRKTSKKKTNFGQKNKK